MIEVQVIRQSYIIHARASSVWQALVDPKIIEKWGAGPATMNDSVGSKFKLWGGDIHGKNIEVIKKKRLVQEWYTGKWKTPSKVHIALSEEHGTTYIDLLQEDVPDGEKDEINKGWKNYYFGPLKNLVENSTE
jgi:activator of HSP90 ATPase